MSGLGSDQESSASERATRATGGEQNLTFEGSSASERVTQVIGGESLASKPAGYLSSMFAGLQLALSQQITLFKITQPRAGNLC